MHAVGVLETALHDRWLRRAAELLGTPAAVVGRSNSHLFALTRLVEVGLRMEAVAEVPGKGRLRKAIKGSPTEEQFLHGTLQLEVAALGLLQDFEVELEPRVRPGRRRVDASLRGPAASLFVEARVVTRSPESLQAGAWADELEQRIACYRMAGVEVTGDVSRTLDERAVEEIESEIAVRSSFVAAGGTATSITMEGVDLDVVHESERQRPLRIAIPGFNLWERLRPALTEKVEETVGSGADWLRIDCAHLLWESSLRHPTLEERGAVLAARVRDWVDGHDHIAGIVLSNAVWTWTPSDRAEEATGAGFTALRGPIDPIRTRETVIVPLDRNPKAAEMWLRLYRDEARWLALALEAQGLPIPPELDRPVASP